MLDIPEPSLVKYYNKNMGGVDRMDQNIAYYCIQFHSKKWCAPSFMFMPDVSVQNSWLLYRKSTLYKVKPLDLLGFRREIVNIHRMKYSTKQRGTIRPPLEITLFKGRLNENRVPTAVRYDGVRHYPLSNPTQRRCGFCDKKSKYVCTKCDVALHIDCFEHFDVLSRIYVRNIE